MSSPAWAAAIFPLAFFAGPAHARSKVLDPLLTFHPGWVTRAVTTHDPRGLNGDGQGGERFEGDYRVLFHEKGEGRIVRIWMTSRSPAVDYQEIWIVLDGLTAYKGAPADLFAGKGPWKTPLVLDYQRSSGAFTSYVPFPYSREAKVLFRGNPAYFQITYREGKGASSGPTSEELHDFLVEDWTVQPPPSPHVLGPGEGVTLATGPLTLSKLALGLSSGSLPAGSYGLVHGLSVRIGAEPPVPASFFFGLGSTGAERLDEPLPSFRSALHAVDAARGIVTTRLPIPLAAGETLRIERSPTATGTLSVASFIENAAAVPGVHLLAQYRDQTTTGGETTLPLFERDGAVQFVSLIESLSECKQGDRTYLEGDEMIRTDGMAHPGTLGTGTEDYFNGGWYFLGPHANPLSGQPRFVALNPGANWESAHFEHALYRHHLLDPLVSRSRMRFGMEVGPTGSYMPLRVRTLGLAYTFDAPTVLGTQRVTGGDGRLVRSAWDAERSAAVVTRHVRAHRGLTDLRFACPGAGARPDGMLLIRTYDAHTADQEAVVRVNGRSVGRFFDGYANPIRRFAQSALWIDLDASDCSNGTVAMTVDASGGAVDFTESEYEAQFFRTAEAIPNLRKGDAVRVLDTRALPEDGRPGAPLVPFYVNDHSAVEDAQGSVHVFGIFHREPYRPDEEREFLHAVCAGPDPGAWREGSCQPLPGERRISLRAVPALGETLLWAPHVVPRGDGTYLMAYHAGLSETHGRPDPNRARMAIAHSNDLEHWTRAPVLPTFEDRCVARDPMIWRTGTLLVMYYTRCDGSGSPRSGVAFRTSADGVTWGEPEMALVLKDTPPMFNSGYTESPFVFERQGWFYLSVTSYPVAWDETVVFRSRSPFSFEHRPIARLRAKAAEWLAKGSDFEAAPLFLTHAGPGQGGIWMSPIEGL